MNALVGFDVGFWDYLTLAVLSLTAMVFLGVVIFILGLPGRIAIARKHPDAEAVYLMGWVGFLAIVPWIQAFIWAFKPTDIIDIRHLPKETQQDEDLMLARLTGKTPQHPDSSHLPH